MQKPQWMMTCVACCKRKPLWALLPACLVLALCVTFWLTRGGPSSVDAASDGPKANPTMVWDVFTGAGLPPATPSHSISLGANTNAPTWGPGKVTVKLPGGRTLDYAPEALSTFEVANVGPEVRLRFPAQPLAAAHAQTKSVLADWRLTTEAAYLDRWFAKRSAQPEQARSTVWVSTMGSRVPAIVTLMQPNREQDQWVVVLQVFPKQVK